MSILMSISGRRSSYVARLDPATLTLNPLATTEVVAGVYPLGVATLTLNSTDIPFKANLDIPIGSISLLNYFGFINQVNDLPEGSLTLEAIDSTVLGLMNLSLGTVVLGATSIATLASQVSLSVGILNAIAQSEDLNLAPDLGAALLTTTGLTPAQINQTQSIPKINLMVAPLLATGDVPPSAPLESTLELVTYDGSRPLLVYTPPNVDAAKLYPMMIFYGGDGSKGVVTTVTAQVLGTGDGVLTHFTGNFTNGSQQDVLATQVIIKVNGVQVGVGDRTGHIVGATIAAGTIAYTGTAGAISVTFTSPITLGHSVTVDYKYCDLLADAGTPVYLNAGDEPEDIFIFAPPITSTAYDLAGHFDEVVNYALANFPIDYGRIYVTGLSRGGQFVRIVIQQRWDKDLVVGTYGIAAYLIVASFYGSDWVWNNYTNIGGWWHHGTSDGNQTYALAGVLNGQAGKTNIPHDTTAYYGRDHETYVWNTMVYNRKNRTDAVGTANFDYIDYLKMFCKGAYLRSTLHVEAAEASLDLHIYRRALREVSLIFGGPAVSLAARLAALKPSLGTIYTIDWGAASNITAGPKINNITSAATGAEILNLVSDEGVISSIGFKVVAQFTTAATKVGVVTRGNGYFRGMDPNFNIDSAIISPAVTTGLVEFNNLPAGTYTILIYPFTGDASPLDAQIRVVINAVQKDMYAEHNTYYNIKYTGLSPDGSNKITIAITSPGAAAGRIQGFDLIKE